METVGLFPNLCKKSSITITENLIKWFYKKGINVYIPKEVVKLITVPNYKEQVKLEDVDIAITLGGDGTLLGAARQLAPLDIPILGINMGRVGFLTEVEICDMYTDLDKLINKDYQIQKRIMLEAQVVREKQPLQKLIALNDVIITKNAFPRLVRLGVFVNDEYVNTYPGDGIIVATPIGSTGYSLSAGGPIVPPNLDALVFTPICPHTLLNRSIILSKDDVIKIQLYLEQKEVVLTIDGLKGYKLLPHDEIIIKKSEFYTKLVKIRDRSFYNILRERLNEGR